MKLRFLWLVLLFTLLITGHSCAQNPAQCDCDGVFAVMMSKLKANYIGYALRQTKMEPQFSARADSFRAIAQRTDARDCTALLEEFLTVFGDGHLFAVEYPKYTDDEIANFKDSIQSRKYDLGTAKDRLIARRETLADVEGVWTDGAWQFAVVENADARWEYEFVAVITAGPSAEKIGEVKFGVNRKGDLYEGTYFSNSYAPRYTTVEPTRESSLLNIRGGLLWGRVENSNEGLMGGAAIYDPSLPTVRQLDADVTLVTFPTFLLDKNKFDNVLIKNTDNITSARFLIVDIRGNGGGNGVYFDFLRLYADRPAQSDIGRALASPDNIAYFEKFAGGGADDPYGPVVEDMRDNPGGIVLGPRFRERALKRMDSRIERVAILTDRANKSAAETFILHSKKISDRVVTIGANTGGVVDYNNVNMVPVSCEALGILFGYPMYTRHARIPADGYNGSGIEPDVPVPDSIEDIVSFAADYLRR